MGTSGKSSCKTAAVMNLLGKGPAQDRDARVLPNNARDIETITGEILDAKRAGGESILTIGRGLMEAKALLSHGEWLPWLAERVEFSEKAAQNFMRIARHYSNPQALADLGATKALMLLAVPDEARDEFISAPHMVDGEEKTVIDMTSRELDAAIKERDEALQAAERAKAEQSAAEQAREKMAADMALANGRIEGLNAEVAEQSARAREAQDAAARLEKELEALRSRPVEVAVEPDAAAIESARKEAEAQMRDQLEQAREAQAQADEARKTALADLAKAQAALEQVRAAEKKTAITADPDLVLFSELLDQAQTLVKRMGGVRLKKKAKDPDTAEKLQAAMMALSTAVKEAAWQ